MFQIWTLQNNERHLVLLDSVTGEVRLSYSLSCAKVPDDPENHLTDFEASTLNEAEADGEVTSHEKYTF